MGLPEEKVSGVKHPTIPYPEGDYGASGWAVVNQPYAVSVDAKAPSGELRRSLTANCRL